MPERMRDLSGYTLVEVTCLSRLGFALARPAGRWTLTEGDRERVPSIPASSPSNTCQMLYPHTKKHISRESGEGSCQKTDEVGKTS